MKRVSNIYHADCEQSILFDKVRRRSPSKKKLVKKINVSAACYHGFFFTDSFWLAQRTPLKRMDCSQYLTYCFGYQLVSWSVSRSVGQSFGLPVSQQDRHSITQSVNNTSSVLSVLCCILFPNLALCFCLLLPHQIQGAIMVSSLFQIFIGFTGLVGFLLRFIGPLTIAPTVTLVGVALFRVAADNAGNMKH